MSTKHGDKSSSRRGPHRRKPVTRDTILISRLRGLMMAGGISQRVLARDAGLGETYITDVLSLKNMNPTLQALQAIAKVLGTTVAYLSGETDHPMNIEAAEAQQGPADLIPRVGVIETGAFRKLQDGAVFPMVQRPLSQTYPDAQHFTLRVADDAMSAAKEGPITPGAEVLCVSLRDAGLTVESGRLYVVRRNNGRGAHETLIRRAMVYKDRAELIPESTRDHYERIVVAGTLGTDPRREIFALGLVYGIFHAFE